MPTQQETAGTGNKPIHTVRHRSIKAAIWKNETSTGMQRHRCSLYQDDNGGGKDSQSIGYDDLMNVAAL
jgi:hypothetical protein